MTLLIQETNACLRLTLLRPEAHNALNNELLLALTNALANAADNPAVRCVLIQGSGERAFCSGIDLVERRTLSTPEMGAQSKAVLKLIRSLVHLPIPVVAAIDGWCLGGGLELALACDLRVATQEARFGFPEMALGTYPGGGGAVMLPRIVGHAKALQLLLSTQRLNAAQALDAGLITAVVPRGDFETTVQKTCDDIAGLAPAAVRAIKESMRRSLLLPLDQAFEMDQLLRRPLDGTNDYKEGLQAFFDKRKPVFTDT